MTKRLWGAGCGVMLAAGISTLVLALEKESAEAKKPSAKGAAAAGFDGETVEPQPIEPFVRKGIQWLVKAQHESGGWGAGSHANQRVRDPHAVQVDPATTAFAASALLRAGHTPTEGEYKDAVRKATEYLVKVVEEYPSPGPKITDISGTQPQTKLGPLVDTSMTAQYLARVLPALEEKDPLHKGVDAALEKCVAKLEESQKGDGSWNLAEGGAGGWAPVLQSSLGCSALELAQTVGKKVDRSRLDKARDYQKGNFDAASGEVKAEAAAGVKLYAFGGAQRANAAESKAADDLVARAKQEGKLAADASVNEESLREAGVAGPQAQKLAEANVAFKAQNAQLNDENLLRGFGSNGGEEYLSYMLSSESLVIQGGKEWTDWNKKMHERLAKVQSDDGSWTGHHCITSPVFCTAAVVQCLTADRDAPLLAKLAQDAAQAAPAESNE